MLAPKAALLYFRAAALEGLEGLFADHVLYFAGVLYRDILGDAQFHEYRA